MYVSKRAQCRYTNNVCFVLIKRKVDNILVGPPTANQFQYVAEIECKINFAVTMHSKISIDLQCSLKTI